MGFDYFYGFMGGETDQWTPYLFRNTTQVFPWVGKPGYNLTTDMADEAIAHMRQLNAAAPDQPFFLYYVPGGTHSPHQPTKEWIDKFKGKFDMGWNALREQIFANQKRLGVIPANTQLTPWPDDLKKWDTLTADEKKLFARQAEVFAGYAAYTDHEIGRVIQEVEDEGKLDNTLIIYISGDNGTSAEGTTVGTPNQYTAYNGILDLPIAEQMKAYDAWGSAATYPHMSVAWSWAFDTPFKWTKQVASHFGGTRQGMAISWPNRIKDAGGIRTQFHHIIDIVPTILEATGIPAPLMVNGIAQKPIEGVSMALHLRQVERQRAVRANDAVFRDVRQPRHLSRRLDRRDDATCAAVAAGHRQAARGRRQRLQVGTLQHRRGLLGEQRPRGQDAGQAPRVAGAVHGGGDEVQRVSAGQLGASAHHRAAAERDGRAEHLHLLGRDIRPARERCTQHPEQVLHDHRRSGHSGQCGSSWACGLTGRQRRDDRHEGGRFGGYGLYLLKGKPVFLYNLLDLERFRWEGQDALAPGKHTIVFDFKYDGPGFGKGGTGVLKVDGKEVANKKIPHTIPFIMAIDETFDVGVDTRTPVDDKDYQVPFRFTGKLDKLTFKLGPVQLTSEEHQVIRHARAGAHN